MQITIPVQNNVETILCDLYFRVDITPMPIVPVRTIEGKTALEHFKQHLQVTVHRAVYECLEALKDAKPAAHTNQPPEKH